MGERIAMAAAAREGARQLVRDYANSVALQISTFPARPTNIATPHAFVDRVRESITYVGPTNYQRRVLVDLMVLWGMFDSGEAVAQRDRFVDGFLPYVAEHFDAVAPNALISGVSVTDVPVYRPDWLEEGRVESYFGTLITLEGYAET